MISHKIDDLEDDFMLFFPELYSYVKSNLDENDIGDWKI